MKKRFTHHSEYGHIESILIKRPEEGFISQSKINSEWEELRFLEPPDLDTSINEYRYFESVLTSTITEVHRLPQNSSVTLDSIYCRDATLITDHGLILCRMGKKQRTLEPQAIREYCLEKNISILGEIEEPGTLEGGDVAWIDEQTLAVGHTYRTNYNGIIQLKKLLTPWDIKVIVVDLPHYRGPSDVFHLMSVFSPIDRDLAVVYSPLMPIAFRNKLLDSNFYLIEVPENEFESMGCNVLAISPRNCIIPQGNPKTVDLMLKAGCNVLTYPCNDISIKGGGGPTCLTRPMKRSMTDTGFN
ncbi:MAG: arginine deiminase family protein [Saprospiraceae bacterium]